MADNKFPSWWSASKDSEPRQFTNANDVPAGWVHRPGYYDQEIGQWVTPNEAEDRAKDKREAAEKAEPNPSDLPNEVDPVSGAVLDAGASAVVRSDRVEGRVRTVPLTEGVAVKPEEPKEPAKRKGRRRGK